MEDTLSIGGVWLNESKAGKKYMKGTVSPYKIDDAPKDVQEAIETLRGYDILLFKNDKKEEGSSQPDYRLCFSKPRPKSDAVENTFGGKEEDDQPF